MVHEGQANGGHYWAFIFDPAKNIWRKFNDITVTEISWEELLRESTGGYRHVSAYCLLYVDATKKDLFNVDDKRQQLPESIRNYLDEDNKNFRQEIEEWDTKRSSKESEAQTGLLKLFDISRSLFSVIEVYNAMGRQSNLQSDQKLVSHEY